MLVVAGVVVLLLLVLRPHPVDHGNTLVGMSSGAPDYLDPGMSYTATGWHTMYPAYNGLLTYKKVEGPEGNELVPDLAAAMPEVTNEGATYTVTMRRGVKFGPPANREVLPSDMKWAIERLFKLPSPGVGFYTIIEGADEYMAGKAKDISGIVVDDEARTIQYNLVQPDPTFNYKMAMLFAVAVPKGVPAKDMTPKGFVPATGPYMLKEYVPQRRILLVRNPNFKEWTPDTPDGKVDKIEIQLGPAADNAATKIRQGVADFSMEALASSQLRRMRDDPEWKPYIHKYFDASLDYVFMNTQEPPFDNLKVRQAVNYAIDRRALVKLMGGRAEPTENFLPPLIPGYRKHDLYPGPDMKKAKELIAESGIKPGKISFWCQAADGPNPIPEYMQTTLNELGFQTELKCLDYAVFYTTIGNPKTKAQIGLYAWSQDYPEGSNFIDVLLNGKRITPEGNHNNAMYTGSDDAIAKANALLDQDARNKAWGDIDEQLMKDAPVAPFAVRVTYEFTSKRLKGYIAHPIMGMLLTNVSVDGKGEE
jgi:peptide/nickel transport system substrate-binding protein